MELYGLNAAMQSIGTLKCINIQWNRRYYEPGGFEIQLRAREWDAQYAYIYTPDRPEIGIVQKVETKHNIKGDFVLVSGYFLECMFNWKVVWYRAAVDGNVADACRQLMTTYMNDLGNLTISVPAGAAIGVPDTFEFEGQNLGDATYGALKLQELSQRLACDCDSRILTYQVWQGKDRTQNQSVNAFASFSQDNGTIDTLTLTVDSSDYYNCAHVVFGNDVHDSVYNLANSNDPLRWLYIISDLSETDYENMDKFKAAVRHATLLELQSHAHLVNIDADVIQRNLRYRVDYDLGDKCDIVDSKTGLAYTARIIEVNEVWKANTHTVSLQFGDKIPTGV